MEFDDVIGLHIITGSSMSDDEIADLIKREEITALASENFAKGKISFQDFLDCLEVAGVNIDEFRQTANNNAYILGF